MIQVDTREYVSALKELVEQGREVSMTISGNSMSPFMVHQRDMILFKQPDRPLKRGDMVFYERPSGQYVMHRICRVKPEGYYIVGDAQWLIEGPVAREQIFAVITKVRRKGQWIGPDDRVWKFFEHVWLRLIPCRRFLVTVYTRLFHH